MASPGDAAHELYVPVYEEPSATGPEDYETAALVSDLGLDNSLDLGDRDEGQLITSAAEDDSNIGPDTDEADAELDDREAVEAGQAVTVTEQGLARLGALSVDVAAQDHVPSADQAADRTALISDAKIHKNHGSEATFSEGTVANSDDSSQSVLYHAANAGESADDQAARTHTPGELPDPAQDKSAEEIERARELKKFQSIPRDSEINRGLNRFRTWGPYRTRAMCRLFQEGTKESTGYSLRLGPHAATFQSIIGDVGSLLAEVRDDLDLSIIMPESYKPAHATAQWNSLDSWQRHQVNDIKDLRRYAIDGAVEKLTFPAIKRQTIDRDTLTVPNYLAQTGIKGDNGKIYSQTCVMSCFRMVFGDIVGWAPTELETKNAMSQAYDGSTIVRHDDDFLNVFRSDLFQQATGQKVNVYSYFGADLNTIGTRAAKVRDAVPDAKVYAMASLGSDTTADQFVWHMVLVNSADRRSVVVHDPSPITGQPNRQLDKRNFATRWARAYNRFHLVVARPL